MLKELSPNAHLETINMEYPTVSGIHEEPGWLVHPQGLSQVTLLPEDLSRAGGSMSKVTLMTIFFS